MSHNTNPHYIIQDMGEIPISRNNGVFLYCKNLNVIDSMNVGDCKTVTFQTGAGKTISKVVRHS